MSFATQLESFQDKTALQFEDESQISYAELAVAADQVFKKDNAPSDSRTLIAIECENNLWSISAYLGALRNNVPAILVDGKLDNELRERLYKHYKISHIWQKDGSWQILHDYTPAIHPDVAIMLSTSGSTGTPKLVRLTASNLQSNADSICEYLQINQDERPITTLPIHYSYGLSVLNTHLNVGASILVTSEPITSRSFWNFFKKYEASSFAGVPTNYAMLKQLRFERMELPSLRTMTQAGGRLAPDMVQWFAELSIKTSRRFFVMYGQTEATARISYVPTQNLLEKIGSIGVAIPAGKLYLIDGQGNEIDRANQQGELCYVGLNVMMGYAETPEDLALPDTLNGILHTGDLAYRDEEGFYYISGRLKRFIKVFGNRVSLDEIEHQLHEDDYNAIVTGQDDLLVIALLKAQSNHEVEEQLKQHIAARYHFHHSAVRVISVDSIPLSSAGKIQYATLLEVALQTLSGR
jgi:acyl-CoA synthetase (AMP-forming)/AMP-acid ligase II